MLTDAGLISAWDMAAGACELRPLLFDKMSTLGDDADDVWRNVAFFGFSFEALGS